MFDGTTRLREAIRYIDTYFNIQQHLICLQLLAKSMAGKEMARKLIATIVGMMHDRAACNGVALRTLTRRCWVLYYI